MLVGMGISKKVWLNSSSKVKPELPNPAKNQEKSSTKERAAVTQVARIPS